MYVCVCLCVFKCMCVSERERERERERENESEKERVPHIIRGCSLYSFCSLGVQQNVTMNLKKTFFTLCPLFYASDVHSTIMLARLFFRRRMTQLVAKLERKRERESEMCESTKAWCR